jgi:hypothetical protein
MKKLDKTNPKKTESSSDLELRLFFIENPEYASKDLVLAAAKKYISSLKSNYTYMRQADYFISKRDLDNDKITSELTVYCELLKEQGITAETIESHISSSSGRHILQ